MLVIVTPRNAAQPHALCGTFQTQAVREAATNIIAEATIEYHVVTLASVVASRYARVTSSDATRHSAAPNAQARPNTDSSLKPWPSISARPRNAYGRGQQCAGAQTLHTPVKAAAMPVSSG